MIPPGEEHDTCREALAGADVNTRDVKGKTPLMLVVTDNLVSDCDHTQCVNELIKAGADVNVADRSGGTALMLALHHAQAKEPSKLVDLLIKSGADVNIQNKEGKTALNLTAMRGNVECLRLLLDGGADVNIVDSQRNTPLFTSVVCEHETVVEALLEAGADVNHCNERGKTVLIEAARYDKNIVLLLVAAGADVNIKDKNNNCALHFACFGVSHCSNMEILLKAGADVNSKNAEGRSPLFCALYRKYDHNFYEEHNPYEEAVNILIKAGADVNADTPDGRTALLSAAEHGFVKCMKALLEKGADVNKGRNREGETALICASRGDHFGCFDSLEAVVDINTACGHYKGLELLLEAGADVNATDSDGGNALILRGHYDYDEYYIRYMNRYPKFIKRLLRAGININKFSRPQGKNALGIFLDYKFKYQNEKDDSMINTEINYDAAIMVLYAAGETLDGIVEDKIPEVIKFEDEKLELKHICREAIRKHLLKLDPHQHLFSRIPELGLPSALSKYLLFNSSLE